MDCSTICRDYETGLWAGMKRRQGKAGAGWRAENPRRTLRACFFGYSKFDGAPTAGPPPLRGSNCVYQRRRETRWGEPVSTTKTPSRLTARNYDYRRVLEHAWCVPWLALSLSLSFSSFPPKNQPPRHARPFNYRTTPLTPKFRTPRAANSAARSLRIPSNSGNKGWSEMMA